MNLSCSSFPGSTEEAEQPLSERLLKLAELVLLIRVRRAEAILIFRPDFWWGALAARLAGAKAIVGHDDRQTQGLLTHRLIKQPTSSHIADLNLALAAFVAGAEPTARRELDFQVTEDDPAGGPDVFWPAPLRRRTSSSST